jgi:hypothetical protein
MTAPPEPFLLLGDGARYLQPAEMLKEQMAL